MAGGEKTEKATPKRMQDERKKGNIFQSHEFVIVASLLGMFYVMKWMGSYLTTTLQDNVRYFFALSATKTTLGGGDLNSILVQSLTVFAKTALPLLLLSGLIAVGLTLAQTKLLFTMESTKFKFSKLNPINGIKKMFSMRGLVELLKSMIKISVLGYILYKEYSKRFMIFPNLIDMEAGEVIDFAVDFVMTLVNSTVMIFVFLALADFLYQKWEYAKNLRMSKEEIKEEYKQTEGDPKVKGKIKEKQRQMAMSRMMQSVPNADVVIRNPTHYAVAIQYSPDKNRAPMVVAKGADQVALRIVKVAEENGVMTIENKPLARGLYDTVDLEREIPEQFYQAVAEVLAFVYSLKKKDLK